ncbi:MAG: endonuclease/exonuclease/phosphatase family protein [Bosea sp.]|nr:endonuclease/exonuclease/phosphatase family protein [Bosea sp. (in: a-proteobacteria)]
MTQLFDVRARSVAAAFAMLLAAATGASATELTVLSFNIRGGGANDGKGVEETVAAIRAVNPDIVGIQESRAESVPCTAEHCPASGESVAAKLAAALGYHFVDQPGESAALWANAILSRYPLGTLTPNKLGARISVDGRAVDIFNVHFTDFPYQPYQALGIEYGNAPFLKTAGELVTAAAAARGPGLALLFADMDAAGPADAAFVFGDFNEPSHHDWVDATVKAGLQPLVVPYPTEKAIEARGFVDTFRAVYPDPVAKPGLTWTPTTSPSDKDDHHDRIDFALAKAEKLEVLSAGILGEKAPEADIVVTPWPSDHRATFAKVRF